MTTYIYIVAQTNTNETVESLCEISQETLELIQPCINDVVNNGGEYKDFDCDGERLEDLYPNWYEDGELTEEVELFVDCLPSGDFECLVGIETIEILNVKSKQVFM